MRNKEQNRNICAIIPAIIAAAAFFAGIFIGLRPTVTSEVLSLGFPEEKIVMLFDNIGEITTASRIFTELENDPDTNRILMYSVQVSAGVDLRRSAVSFDAVNGMIYVTLPAPEILKSCPVEDSFTVYECESGSFMHHPNGFSLENSNKSAVCKAIKDGILPEAEETAVSFVNELLNAAFDVGLFDFSVNQIN